MHHSALYPFMVCLGMCLNQTEGRKSGNPLDNLPPNIEILTHFNEYEGGKASNPVVSADGRFMAFQSAKATYPAGVGYGILIYGFNN
jgi:hypothetical protein